MVEQPGLFDIEERLRVFSAKGDDLERVNALVDFVMFRPELERAVPRADHVLMFRIMILQASNSLSDERTEYLIKDRLSFMRFLGLSLADRVPDANSIWNFREALKRATLNGVPLATGRHPPIPPRRRDHSDIRGHRDCGSFALFVTHLNTSVGFK